MRPCSGWPRGMAMVRSILVMCFLLFAALPAWGQGTVLVEFGSSMVYLVNSSDPGIGIDWTEKDFPNGWPPGTYGVGYGAGTLVQTSVPSGTSSVYTRATFNLVDASSVTNLFVAADYDDGTMMWINGEEVFRSPGMPDTPTWNTAPSSHEASNGLPPDYGTLVDASAAMSFLVDGDNVLVVGVWNRNDTSSDLVVVPQLLMNIPSFVTRGPYLQWATPDSIIVRWRTSLPTDSRVRYGSAPGSLTQTLDEVALTQDHEITIPGLSADTFYYYSVGDSGAVLAGDDSDHYFRTAPLVGTRRPLRVWVIGDSGTANGDARDVRDAYRNFTQGVHTDLWLMLGDNAYNSGTIEEYQAAVFDIYPEILRTSALFATLGNHDDGSASTLALTGPYYDVFTYQDDGVLGSGTEAYYSFDFANIHFVCLNSQELNATFVADQFAWLQTDLMNHAQDWTIVFFHHPPYT
ncbi:MAG: metallophosphoesterase family protein, partial [Acidobacteria bacterium]